jgi:histidinol-phosphate aminotransferase
MNIEALARPEIVALRPYSSARREAPARGILLNANEAPRSLLAEAGRGDDWEARLNRYPDPQPQALVERLAALYGTRPDQVLVTRGSDEGIDLLTRVFCRAGRDAVLHCPPTFGMYRIAAATQGAAIVSLPRSPADGFRLDGQGLLAALAANRSADQNTDQNAAEQIKLVFLTSPNNPTGDGIGQALLLEILEQARGRAVVVVDEAYAEFCDLPSSAGLIGEHENLAVLRTLSKAWAAAGLRCGVVLAQPGLIALLQRVIAPYPLPSPVIALALRVLQDDMLARQRELLAEVARNKRTLLAALAGRSFLSEVLPGEANFVLVRVGSGVGSGVNSGVDSAAGTGADPAGTLLAFCAERGVILRGFPAEPLLRGYIRISVGTRDEIAALSAVLDEWGQRT